MTVYLDADGVPTTADLALRRVRRLSGAVLTPGGVPWTIAGLAMHAAIEGAEDRGV